MTIPNGSMAPDRTYSLRNLDPIASFLDATMAGGTSLLVGVELNASSPGMSAEDYFLLKSEVILEYERTIADLRRQLLHYKKLVAELIPQRDSDAEYGASHGVQPVDASSVKIVNSVLQARVPDSSVFRDFEEQEL